VPAPPPSPELAQLQALLETQAAVLLQLEAQKQRTEALA
jgi:hypothetical protein